MQIGKLFRTVRGRIQYGTLLLSVVPMLLVGVLIGTAAFLFARQNLQERAVQHVVTLRTDKAARVSDYFDNLRAEITFLGNLRVSNQSVAALQAALPSLSTAVNQVQARERMQRYYQGELQQEYARHNGGTNVDVKPLLEQMDDTAFALQYQYLASNPNPLGDKHKLEAADQLAYGKAHADYHERAERFVEASGVKDVYLVDAGSGVVLYSYAKEIDFGTSLLNGPFAKSELGNTFRQVRDQGAQAAFVMSSTNPYLATYDDSATFMATPVRDGNRLVGVLIVRSSIDKLNAIMTHDRKWREGGMGETGETYLVGATGQVQSITRTMAEQPEQYLQLLRDTKTPEAVIKRVEAKKTNVDIVTIESTAIAAARRGESGAELYHDYRGVPVIGAYAPLEVLGRSWTILAEFDQAEAFAPVDALLRQLLLVGVGVLLLTLLVAAVLSTRLARSINRPIATLQDTVAKLSAGDLDARTRMPPRDELGQLGSALDSLLDERVNSLANAARENEQLNHSVIEIMHAVSRLSSRDLTVKVPVTPDVTGAISDALNLMTSQTAQVLRNVNDISSQVADASSRVRERSEQAMVVAGEGSKEIEQASQELSEAASALKDIAERAGHADRFAEEAITSTREALQSVRETVGGISASRELIRETEKRIKRLGERSQEITAAVNLIGNIAERTSMLALNTSMQAVAAGEAGRAYAVVADEVKRLAESARGATQQISNLVGAIQSETVDTVEAINRAIGQVVEISRLAERAGEQMHSTEEKTNQLVTSVRSIAQTTDLQSRASDTLQARARQIRTTTRQTSEQLASQAQESRNLNDYANGLLESVRVFTLPA